MAKPSRKPHAKSKLKTLPEEVQARIADWCAQDSLESAVSRCLSELRPPISTNRDSMGKFFAWWQTEQETKTRTETLEHLFRRADANAKAVAEMLSKTGATPAQIAAADQLVFTLQASSNEDKEMFIELEKLRLAKESAVTNARIAEAKIAQKEREIRLAIEKFQFDGAKAVLAHLAELRTIASDRGLKEPERIEQVRMRLWGTAPEAAKE